MTIAYKGDYDPVTDRVFDGTNWRNLAEAMGEKVCVEIGSVAGVRVYSSQDPTLTPDQFHLISKWPPETDAAPGDRVQ